MRDVIEDIVPLSESSVVLETVTGTAGEVNSQPPAREPREQLCQEGSLPAAFPRERRMQILEACYI